MKTIKTATKALTLKDLYKVGDVLKYTNNWYNGPHVRTEVMYLTVVKVNKVTIDCTNEQMDVVRLDGFDRNNCKKVYIERSSCLICPDQSPILYS